MKNIYNDWLSILKVFLRCSKGNEHHRQLNGECRCIAYWSLWITFSTWLHFYVIKGNQKALLKDQKQTKIFILDNVKRSNFNFFAELRPWSPRPLIRMLTSFASLFLIYMFTLRKTGNSIHFSYFDPPRYCRFLCELFQFTKKFLPLLTL